MVDTLASTILAAPLAGLTVGGAPVNVRPIPLALRPSTIADIVDRGAEDLVERLQAASSAGASDHDFRVFPLTAPVSDAGERTMTYRLESLEIVSADQRPILVQAQYAASLRVPQSAGVIALETIAGNVGDSLDGATQPTVLTSISQVEETETRNLRADIQVGVTYLATAQTGSETFADAQRLPAVLCYCARRGAGDEDDAYAREASIVSRTWAALAVSAVGGDALATAEEVRNRLITTRLAHGWSDLSLVDGGPDAVDAGVEIWKDLYADTVAFAR